MNGNLQTIFSNFPDVDTFSEQEKSLKMFRMIFARVAVLWRQSVDCHRSLLHTSIPRYQQHSSSEQKMISILHTAFPGATDIAVVDVSGGCGSMYEVFVEAPQFRDVKLVKQHRMVTEALKSEIGEMHGIRIMTQRSPETE